MKTIKLESGKTVEIGKLPLGKYSQLLTALKTLPTKLPELSGLTPSEVLVKLPDLVGSSLPDFINILTIATPLTTEEIEASSLEEVVDIVLVVVEVNNYQGIYDKVKKALARPVEVKV